VKPNEMSVLTGVIRSLLLEFGAKCLGSARGTQFGNHWFSTRRMQYWRS